MTLWGATRCPGLCLGLVTMLEAEGLQNETRELEPFYESVRRRAQALDNAEARQRVLLELYERFFSLAMQKGTRNGWALSTRPWRWWISFCTPPTTPCSSISGGG